MDGPEGYLLDSVGRPKSWLFDDTYPTGLQGVYIRTALDAMYTSVEGFTWFMPVNIDPTYLLASPLRSAWMIGGVYPAVSPNSLVLEMKLWNQGRLAAQFIGENGTRVAAYRTPNAYITVSGRHTVGFRYDRLEASEALRGTWFFDGLPVTDKSQHVAFGAGVLEPIRRPRNPWYIGGYSYAADGVGGGSTVVPAKEIAGPCGWDTTLLDGDMLSLHNGHVAGGWTGS